MKTALLTTLCGLIWFACWLGLFFALRAEDRVDKSTGCTGLLGSLIQLAERHQLR